MPQHHSNTAALLEVRELSVSFRTDEGIVRACDHVSYTVSAGETVAIVGESGSGKSVSALSILGLAISGPAAHVDGEVLLDGRDVLKLSRKALQKIRGRDVAMVFQDPMTSLNPVKRVGWQIAEMLMLHGCRDKRKARQRAEELLHVVGVPSPETRYDQYPHQFSGGMRQRAMIAMAIANSPRLLIADEPTTALDVTIQAQILDVLRTAREATGAACILITHDLGVVAELADRVIVMYAGHVVESGTVKQIFHTPRHPYTVGLLNSRPSLSSSASALQPIPGNPPNLTDPPQGCAFRPRCVRADRRDECATSAPDLVSTDQSGHQSRCHFWGELTTVTSGSTRKEPA
jgi:oligopeptide/dipeptide ABC transporter ATP-binding protein